MSQTARGKAHVEEVLVVRGGLDAREVLELHRNLDDEFLSSALRRVLCQLSFCRLTTMMPVFWRGWTGRAVENKR